MSIFMAFPFSTYRQGLGETIVRFFVKAFDLTALDVTNRRNGEWETGNGSLGTSSQQNTAAKRTAHKQKIQHPLMITFVFPIAYINQLRKYKTIKIYIKTKSKKLEQKVKKKTVSFENLFIFLVSDFCTKGFNFWLHQC